MCTFILCFECFFFLTLISPSTGLLCLFYHDLLKKNPRNKKSIPFRFAKHNMSSKIIGWLVGAWDGKIMELRIQSGINKNSGKNPISLVHIFSRIFQEFLGLSKIQDLFFYSW